MNFYSTRHQSPQVGFKNAVLDSLPSDNGLYMPETITPLPSNFLTQLPSLSFDAHSFIVAKCLLGNSIPDKILKEIITDTLNFDCPLLPIEENISVLELTHGPSLAFKDFGARFMARVMRYLTKDDKRGLNVLVATSGDTGGAVALGFLGVPGIRVHILYPSEKVSEGQEKQLTALGRNITAYEIKGSFDDCQAMVKKAFLDQELNEKKWLTSANSINIARLIPQAFYYVEAYKQAMKKNKQIVFCTPSGNFGNLTAGLLAKKIGLPIHHFIAANNSNDPVLRYLESGNYEPRPTVSTLSNAMDVGAPSNFVRMLDLYKNDLNALRKDITAYKVTEEETKKSMKALWDNYQYIACPHTAVAYNATLKFMNENPKDNNHCIFLSTAHPSKFNEPVKSITGQSPVMPPQLLKLMNKNSVRFKMEPNFELFKDMLLHNIK